MQERTTLNRLDDFALPLPRRTVPAAYMARVCGWSASVEEGVWRFHEMARQWGVIVEDRIPNPDEGQVGYMAQVLGTDFQPTAAFAEAALVRWMPRMSEANRRAFGEALARQYDALRRRGKPDGVLKNLYTKLMCWLYYRFERLMPLLGRDDAPKLLYMGEAVTAHELTMLAMLRDMGVDALLVLTGGDGAYLRVDPDSQWSQLYAEAGMGPFPEGLSLKRLRQAHRTAPSQAASRPQPSGPAPKRPSGGAPTPIRQGTGARDNTPPTPPPRHGAGDRGDVPPTAPPRTAPVRAENYFKAPAYDLCTNAWMTEPDYNQLLTPPPARGDDPKLLYNGFIRLRGVRDRLDYLNDLHRLYRQLVDGERTVVAVDGPLPKAEPEALNAVRRRSRYASTEEMIVDLAGNLPADAPEALQRLMQRAFAQVVRLAAQDAPNPNRLLATAVVLLCRIRRYHAPLFKGWKPDQVPVFILMGGCGDADDALYARWLARMPVDVLLPVPNLERPCALSDEMLLELTGEESLDVAQFPRDDATLRLSTMAAHAEKDLDALLYADSGLYRNRQFVRANAVTLRTTYDELFILWDQELRYRPGFSADGDGVTMPVLFAKVSGVEGGRLPAYWQKVRQLAGGDALFVRQLPMPLEAGAYQALALKALKNGHIDRRVLRQDRRYPFALLREELQDHLFDKLQLMLDRRLVEGTFVNGTEYTVLATALGMGKELLRRLQAFDFTRKNPKVVCVDAKEGGATLQDAILLTLLNLVGFDVALFAPTGYRTVERFLADNLPVEHQIGEYIYDLTPPELDAMPQAKPSGWLDRLFRREK
ncbi:MAG: hypothetical protein IJI26_07500 [Clostridia bacterium]|nr:hypothetical protein [Clostridia bacterium]